jgi:glutamine amidotransferase
VIALVDYGAGNLTSVRKALSAIGAAVWTPARPAELERARGVIVPGVGHFDATRALTDEWRAAIRSAIDGGKPMLGICVGLQWLFEGSTEAPNVPGLGVFHGTCARLGIDKPNQPPPRLRRSAEAFAKAEGLSPQDLGQSEPSRGEQTRGDKPSGLSAPMLKVPHVGWNSLSMPRASALMAGIRPDTQVYFTHSYAAPVVDDTAAICEYGIPFSAAVEREHVAAVQFHPEKSGEAGLQILRNWLSRAQ